MATSAEYTFVSSVAKAEGVRQVAKTAAFTTNQVNGIIPPANLAAYVTALEAADNAFVTALNAAASTAGAVGTVNQGQTGAAGQAFIPSVNIGGAFAADGPIRGNTATFGSVG